MKKTLVLSTLLGGGILVTTMLVRSVERPQAEPPAGTGLETVSLEVQGMESLMCEIGVESALENLDGVRNASVDREGGRAEVTFDPAVVRPGAFVDAVTAIGFGARLPEGAIQAAEPAGAAGDPPTAHKATAAARLTPEEIEKVAAFVADHVLANKELPSGEEIEAATHVELSIADTPVVQQAVLARLTNDPRGQELLAGSRCSDYGACSLWGNLATASGETLALYQREKALDGETYAGLALPTFEARNLAGETVRSTDLLGRPALLVLLAVHCNHSMDTFPVLQELHRRYAKDGLQVVGVLVNSGSPEDANGWVPQFAPEYPVWVYSESSLGDLVGSHLVPTYLLIDEQGNITKRLVGFKDKQTLLADVAQIHSAGA